MMIKALKEVQRTCPETYLILVGDGPERANLEKMASSLKLNSKILITGFKEDTHRFYNIMDMFLLTSFSEGTAMTLLEAMASSLTCIVTDVGGNPEIVVDSQTGFVIPSDDEKALASVICGLLKNKDLLKKMGQAARRRFENEFAIDKMVHSYQAMYDSVGL
jgi:glycosyltransferase involved in cell wall biosynthesis